MKRMWMIGIVIIAVFACALFLVPNVYAQEDVNIDPNNVSCASGTTPPDEAWNRTFGGNSPDLASSVQQTIDGGYIVAGYTYSYGAGEDDGDGDAWLVKTDSDGNEGWNKTFGGTCWDAMHAVQQTADGGYILAGPTESYGAGDIDAWLVKTDSDGNEEWNKTFGGTGWDYPHAVQQTADGGYILVAETESYGAGSYDAWLVKTDSKGNEEWNKTFGGTGWDYAHSVQQTTDGGYILAGATGSYGPGWPFWLVKTDSKGNEQWNRTFGGAGAMSVQQTVDGGYILLGDAESSSAGDYDFRLVKADSCGNEQWNRTFGGNSWEGARLVQQTADGGYILVGDTKSYGAGNCDFWLVKADSKGNEQWNKTFGGVNWDEARSVQQTADGGYILAGRTCSYGAGGFDFWLIKVRIKGEQETQTIMVNNVSEIHFQCLAMQNM